MPSLAVDDGLGWWSAWTVADDTVCPWLIVEIEAEDDSHHGSSLFATRGTADGRSMDDAGSSLAGGVCVDGMVGAEVLDDS